jgi:hypothetical protein
MKKKVEVVANEDDFLDDLDFHYFSATLLTEFSQKIMSSYYAVTMSDALKDLVQNRSKNKSLYEAKLGQK